MFLEKAFAKLYGGYANLCNCNPGTILTELTGAPVNHISLNDENLCWRDIESALKGKCLVLANTRKEAKSLRPDCNLLPNYSYKVTEMKMFDYRGNRMTKFLMMQDPLLTKKKKKFGKNYPKEYYRTLLGRGETKYTLRAKNCFWIEFDDLQNNFDIIITSKIQEKYCFSTLEVPYSDLNASREQIFLFKCKAPSNTKGLISCYRKNCRSYVLGHPKQENLYEKDQKQRQKENT